MPDEDFCYCNDIDGLMKELKVVYNPKDWRLFIDSSKFGLKAVLLHNGNEKKSVPIGYSATMKETYDNLARVINLINYSKHEWQVCSDLKVVAIVLGLQSGYTKYVCFLCLWDSRDRKSHYIRKDWPRRQNAVIGKNNVKNMPLVNPENIIPPALHLKLGLIKNFVKALDKERPAFSL